MGISLRAFAPKTNGAPAGAIDYFFGFDTACRAGIFLYTNPALLQRLILDDAHQHQDDRRQKREVEKRRGCTTKPARRLQEHGYRNSSTIKTVASIF
jgi:hypothetical protein